jgi:hypothetical protein
MLWLGACLAVVGCNEEAKTESGIEADVQVLSRPAGNQCADGVEPGDEGQSFCRSTGERMDLINGLILPAPARLIECTSVASVARDILAGLISQAHAHGGHVDAPEGVVDVAEPSGTVWKMATLPPPPGRYCGIELTLEHLPPDALPHDLVAEPHDNVFLYTRPCYFPNPAPAPPEHNHSCYTVPIRGTPPVVQIDFDEPVTLGSDNRRLTVTIDTAYDTWFDGVDFAQIATAAEQQKIVDNVIDSLTVQIPAEHAP